METSEVNRKAVGLVTLVFVLGIALGVVGTRLVRVRAFAARVSRPSGSGQLGYVSRLTQELNLTSDQQMQINDILADTQTRYNNVRQYADLQYQQIRTDGRDQIRQNLTPEQQAKFEAFLQHLQEERRKRDNQSH